MLLNPNPERFHVNFYVGEPGSGKSTLALQHAIELSQLRDVPILLMDGESVIEPWQLEWDVEARSLPEIELALAEGKHVRYTALNRTDAIPVFQKVHEVGHVILAIDEASTWARGNQAVPELIETARIYRHLKLDLILTTQYPGDLTPVLWATKTDIFAFRNQSLESLDRLSRETRTPVDGLAFLADLPDLAVARWNTRAGWVRGS